MQAYCKSRVNPYDSATSLASPSSFLLPITIQETNINIRSQYSLTNIVGYGGLTIIDVQLLQILVHIFFGCLKLLPLKLPFLHYKLESDCIVTAFSVIHSLNYIISILLCLETLYPFSLDIPSRLTDHGDRVSSNIC